MTKATPAGVYHYHAIDAANSIGRQTKLIILVALSALTIGLGFIWRSVISTRLVLSHREDNSSSCRWLQSDGELEGNRTWWPHGCSSAAHWYKPEEARLCFRRMAERGRRNKTVVLFLGDSKIRDLCVAFLQIFANKHQSFRAGEAWMDHNNIHVEDAKLRLIQKFRAKMNNSFVAEMEQSWRTIKPTHIVAGSFLWHHLHKSVANLTCRAFPAWAALANSYFGAVEEAASRLAADGSLVWVLPDPVRSGIEHQDSLHNLHLRLNRRIKDQVTPAMLGTLKHYPRILAWTSAANITQRMIDKEGESKVFRDAFHLQELPRMMQAQVLMNFYCNHLMMNSH